MREDATIVAQSSAQGVCGVSVIRMSGPDAAKIALRCFKGKKNLKLDADNTRRLFHGWMMDGDKPIDEVLLLWMQGPATYTGEDTVEIDCHGGIYVTKRILELLVANGATPAERGEFSKRAFLNGKMSLSEAEAVMDVIAADTSMSHEASVSALRGALALRVEEALSEIMDMMAVEEANIDYPEYDVPALSRENFVRRVQELLDKLNQLRDTADAGRLIKEGIRVALVGAPNVGKSSVLNLLLGEERAIVTDIAGTTRDTIEESCELRGMKLCLIDTAGIRESEDRIEAMGVERSRKALNACDLALLVLDASREMTAEESALLEEVRAKAHLVLWNKTDVGAVMPEGGLPSDFIPFSAKSGEGLDALSKRVYELFFNGLPSGADAAIIMNLRQKEALTRGSNALSAVLEGAAAGMETDLLMIDLREAYNALGELYGHSVSEELTTEIFSRFCLGK